MKCLILEYTYVVLRVLSSVAFKHNLRAPVQIGVKTTSIEKCRPTRVLLGIMHP